MIILYHTFCNNKNIFHEIFGPESKHHSVLINKIYYKITYAGWNSQVSYQCARKLLLKMDLTFCSNN